MHQQPTAHRFVLIAAAAAALATAGTSVLAGQFSWNPAPTHLAQSQDRVTTLNKIVSHLDHCISILSVERPDAQGHRKAALDNVTSARDLMVREIDELEGRKSGNQDVKQNHEGDKEGKKAQPKDYASGLQTVVEYLQHDQDALSKEQGDKAGDRGKALKHMKTAEEHVVKELEAIQNRK